MNRWLREMRRAVFEVLGMGHRPWTLDERLIYIDVVRDLTGTLIPLGDGEELGVLAVRRGEVWVPVLREDFEPWLPTVLDREIVVYRPVRIRAGLMEYQRFKEEGLWTSG